MNAYKYDRCIWEIANYNQSSSQRGYEYPKEDYGTLSYENMYVFKYMQTW